MISQTKLQPHILRSGSDSSDNSEVSPLAMPPCQTWALNHCLFYWRALFVSKRKQIDPAHCLMAHCLNCFDQTASVSQNISNKLKISNSLKTSEQTPSVTEGRHVTLQVWDGRGKQEEYTARLDLLLCHSTIPPHLLLQELQRIRAGRTWASVSFYALLF